MIQRTLSIRVLVMTFVAAVVCGGSALLIHRWQISRTAKSFLTHAQTQEQAKNWLKAAEYLERYLRLLPDDARARVRLAETYVQGADSLARKRQAVSLHFRALGAGAADRELRLRERLAELLVETGRHLESEQEARKVLASEPGNSRAQRALALSLWKQVADGSLTGKRTGQAKVMQTVLQASDRNPADVDLAVVAATLYREHPQVVALEFPQLTEPERQHAADQCLDRLIAAGKDQKCWLARHLYREQYRLAGADEDLAQALSIAPDDPAVLMTAAADAFRQAQLLASQPAESAGAKAHFAKAKAYYHRLAEKKNVATVAEWHLGLGAAQLGLGEVDEALLSWRKGARIFEQPSVQAEFHSQIADALLAHQRYDEASESLESLDELIKSFDASVPREQLVALDQAQDLRWATWHLARQQPVAAVPRLQKVISRLTSSDVQGNAPLRAWLMLGQAYSALGQWLEAAAAYDRAAALAPQMAAAHAAAANAWLLAGRPELASERAEEAIAHRASYAAWFTLAAAQTQIQSLAAPAQQSWTRCEAALAALESAPAADLGEAPWKVGLLRADYLVAKWQSAGEPDRGRAEAAAALRTAEANYPRAAAFWAIIVPYYGQLGAAIDADRALAQLQQLPDAGLEATVAAARLASQRKEFDSARLLLEEAARTLPASSASALRSELVQVALAKQDYPLARSLLLKQHAQQPQELLTLRRLAELDLETKNFAGLTQWEQKLDAIRPAGQPLAGYYRACRLLVSATSPDDEQLRTALTEQAQVTAQRPAWAEAVSLRGMIEQRLGRLESAVEAYVEAIELGERRTLVFEQLIGLLDQLNRSAECEKYLSRLAAQLPLSQRLTELAGVHQVKTDRPEEAVTIARQRIERQPEDALARVWLGRLLTITGELAEAERQFEQAIELAPDDVRSWSGMFSFQLRRGEQDEARRTLSQLVQRVKLEPAERSFVLAQGHELIGDLVEAERHYREAARLSPDSGAVQLRLAGLLLRSDPTQAENCLVRVLEIDPKSVVARRMLAVVLASRGTDDDLRRVETLLAESGADDRAASEDLRLKALLLAQRGGTTNLIRAVKLLEEMIDRGIGAGPGERMILAQLNEALGRSSADAGEVTKRFEAARQLLNSLAARPDSEPLHLAALIGFLLRHDRRDEAGMWLDKLEDRLAAAPRDKAEAIGQLISLRLQHGSAASCGPWLDRLTKLQTNPVQLLALRARWLAAVDPQADIEAIVEPAAQRLIADAKDDKQRQKLLRGLGDVYSGAKQYAPAERWYRQLAAVAPAEFHRVAGALAKQGKIGAAIDYCSEQAATDKTSQPAIALAAVLVESAPKPEVFQRAEPVLDAAVQQFARDEKLLYAVGVLRVMQGRYEESTDLFRKVIAINPKNVPAINNLALLLAENAANRPEALALIDKAIDISGTEADLLDTKGAILVYDGQSDQAVSLLEAAARSASSDPRYSFHLAVAYRDTNKTEQAKVELRSALDRQLESQVLTPTDRKLLEELKTTLTP